MKHRGCQRRGIDVSVCARIFQCIRVRFEHCFLVPKALSSHLIRPRLGENQALARTWSLTLDQKVHTITWQNPPGWGTSIPVDRVHRAYQPTCRLVNKIDIAKPKTLPTLKVSSITFTPDLPTARVTLWVISLQVKLGTFTVRAGTTWSCRNRNYSGRAITLFSPCWSYRALDPKINFHG